MQHWVYWIIIGTISGWAASRIVNQRGEGCILNMALGIAGAMVGGALFEFLGTPVYWGFNVESVVVSILGAVIVLFAFHALSGPGRFN